MSINCYVYRKRDGELGIRQKELQLEYRHAQLKEQLNVRLSCGSEFKYNFKRNKTKKQLMLIQSHCFVCI